MSEPGSPRSTARSTARIAAVAVLAVVMGVLLALVLTRDDETDAPPTPSTAAPTTAPPTTGPVTTSPPTTGPTTSSAAPADTDTAVWPDPGSARRFTDPVEAAASFATDFVGFVDPVVGEFLAGDSRSGEVDVRPVEDGPITTVFVRLLGSDGTWWVLGSATADIEVDEPAALTAIGRPLHVAGRARAFEGTVAVEVRADDTTSPLGTGQVLGRGDGVLGPFEGDIEYAAPASPRGAVVFLTHSAEDGRVWQAGVIRIEFPEA